jgi:hypothetical protein
MSTDGVYRGLATRFVPLGGCKGTFDFLSFFGGLAAFICLVAAGDSDLCECENPEKAAVATGADAVTATAAVADAVVADPANTDVSKVPPGEAFSSNCNASVS